MTNTFKFSDGTFASSESKSGPDDFYTGCDNDELAGLASFDEFAKRELDARWAMGA